MRQIVPTDGMASIAGRFWRSVFILAWEGLTIASHTMSDALIAASTVIDDRTTKGPAGQHADGKPWHRDVDPIPTVDIVRLVEAYLLRIPGEGGVLQDVVARVAVCTGYDKKRIETVIRQHFPSNGILVWR
jgi:hypothetical protein